MKIDEFIKNFSEQFDDADPKLFKPETKFRELSEWTSMAALSVLGMIDLEYDIQITPTEMQKVNSIQELYDLVLSKE